MKKYIFNVTGASLYGGVIIIIAKTIKVARRLAKFTVARYNEESNTWSDIRLTGEEHCAPFDPPCVVYFESEEA